MDKRVVGLLIVVVAAVAFGAGSWRSSRRSAAPDAASTRHVLYYSCPMHPLYRSDKAGECPSCGMRLTPVYSDHAGTDTASQAVSLPGAIRIAADKQQLMGLQVGTVERAAGRRVLRVPGRVVPDETRIYRINAAVEGWVQEIHPNSTGSAVRKNQVLAAFYAPEFLSAQQAYLYALSSLDRFHASGKETPDQIALTKAAVQQAADTLRNLGMTETQVAAIERRRDLVQRVEIRSPADGIVLQRDVSPGQRFEKGTEFYRIADLRHVWILADVFGGDRRYLRPGLTARVTMPEEALTIEGRVTDVPPQFDPVSRTLKVRLEADNPRDVLRPDMFVDVEIDVAFPEAVTVPPEAVIDSGLRKTVFVERGSGIFEPRQVRTGWKSADRVQILEGLDPGERIAVSGAFLMDSDSRMKAGLDHRTAPAVPVEAVPTAGNEGAPGATPAVDPVCHMRVDPASARRAGLVASRDGRTHFFCSEECRRKFEKQPTAYIDR